jgi:hypothetical protein
VLEQEAMPDVASEPEKRTGRARLYHPLASGPRSGEALTDGAVASYRNETEPLPLFPALSVQLPPTLVPSVSGPL